MSLVKKAVNPGGFKPGVSGNPKGRAKGSKDKISRIAAKRVLEAALRDAAGKTADKDAKTLTPLGFMENVLRTPSAYPFSARQWAAEHAAPYLHRKMPIAIEGGDKPLVFLDAAKLASMPTSEVEKLVALLETVAPSV
jgi:Family of unknown function (DUF5681)